MINAQYRSGDEERLYTNAEDTYFELLVRDANSTRKLQK